MRQPIVDADSAGAEQARDDARVAMMRCGGQRRLSCLRSRIMISSALCVLEHRSFKFNGLPFSLSLSASQCPCLPHTLSHLLSFSLTHTLSPPQALSLTFSLRVPPYLFLANIR